MRACGAMLQESSEEAFHKMEVSFSTLVPSVTDLGAYECQVGDVEVAKARLKYAIQLDPGCRAKALDDDDLKALWDREDER
jgi:hypothetical protein